MTAMIQSWGETWAWTWAAHGLTQAPLARLHRTVSRVHSLLAAPNHRRRLRLPKGQHFQQGDARNERALEESWDDVSTGIRAVDASLHPCETEDMCTFYLYMCQNYMNLRSLQTLLDTVLSPQLHPCATVLLW